MIVGLVRLYQVKKQFWHSLKRCESWNDNWGRMVFGAWNLPCVHQDNWEGWWRGATKEEPTHSKDCFILEFPLDKLREWGRGWGTGEGRSWACWCFLPEKLIGGWRWWLWTWIPDPSSLSQPCNRLMTHWEPFNHFHSFLHNFFFFFFIWKPMVSLPYLHGPCWAGDQLKESLKTAWWLPDVSMRLTFPLHWNPFGKRSQLVVLKL